MIIFGSVFFFAYGSSEFAVWSDNQLNDEGKVNEGNLMSCKLSLFFFNFSVLIELDWTLEKMSLEGKVQRVMEKCNMIEIIQLSEYI